MIVGLNRRSNVVAILGKAALIAVETIEPFLVFKLSLLVL